MGNCPLKEPVALRLQLLWTIVSGFVPTGTTKVIGLTRLMKETCKKLLSSKWLDRSMKEHQNMKLHTFRPTLGSTPVKEIEVPYFGYFRLSAL